MQTSLDHDRSACSLYCRFVPFIVRSLRAIVTRHAIVKTAVLSDQSCCSSNRKGTITVVLLFSVLSLRAIVVLEFPMKTTAPWNQLWH